MNRILTLVFVFFSCTAFCQQPKIEWVKSFGGSQFDYPAKIVEMADGNYLILGGTQSNDFDITQNRGKFDIWLIKLSKTGSIIWQKTFGGSKDDAPLGLGKTKDGNYVIGGTSQSNDGDFTINQGLDDAFVWKIDPNGNVLWKKNFGGSKNDNLENLNVASNGDLLMSISSESNDSDFPINDGDDDVWIVRLNEKGELKWKKHYGGSKYDYINETIELDNNSTLSVGITGSQDKDFGNLYNDFMIKLDSVGNEIWSQSQNKKDPRATFFSTAGLFSTNFTLGQGFFNVGSASVFETVPNHVYRDMFVSKFDINGTLIWQKSYGGEGVDYARDIIKTSDNNYFIIGTQASDKGDVNCRIGKSDAWLIKIDTSGKLLWQQCLGGSENDVNDAGGIILTQDNSLVVLVGHQSKDGIFNKMRGLIDIGVVKFSNIVTSSQELANDNIKIYPNPVSSSFFLNYSLNDYPISLKIYNLQGQLIATKTVHQDREEIATNELNDGIYIMTIEKNNRLISRNKIIVNKN
jgi:Secretion system C-terminal sorting domain